MPLSRIPDRRHPGRGDGEALRPGWIAQPVCAASSAALAVAAVLLERSARRSRGADRLAGRALSAALVANAVGSAGFHGPGDRFSRALHDVSLAAVVTVCAGGALRALVRDPADAVRSLAVPVALLVGGAAIGRLGRSGGPWCRPHSPVQGHAVWHVLAAAGVGLAGRRMFGPGPVDGAWRDHPSPPVTAGRGRRAALRRLARTRASWGS